MTRRELSLIRRWWKEDFKRMIQAREDAEARYRARHGLVEPSSKQLKKHFLEMVPREAFPKNLAWDYPPQIYENINIPIPSDIAKILGKTWDWTEVSGVSSREDRIRKNRTSMPEQPVHTCFENKDYALSKFMYEEDGFVEYAERMARIARLQFSEKYEDNPGDDVDGDTGRTESRLEDTR